MEHIFKRSLTAVVISAFLLQITGCGTLLYPERKGQREGHLDAGIVILDAIGLLFFLIPGIIAFAVDFGDGTIYVPATGSLHAKLREIKFDPKHTTLAQVEQIIKDKTGYSVKLTQGNVRVARLQSKEDMMQHFAQAESENNTDRLALNRS